MRKHPAWRPVAFSSLDGPAGASAALVRYNRWQRTGLAALQLRLHAEERPLGVRVDDSSAGCLISLRRGMGSRRGRGVSRIVQADVVGLPLADRRDCERPIVQRIVNEYLGRERICVNNVNQHPGEFTRGTPRFYTEVTPQHTERLLTRHRSGRRWTKNSSDDTLMHVPTHLQPG